jgi:hypothetical protein
MDSNNLMVLAGLFLPVIIAGLRRHHNAIAIGLVNAICVAPALLPPSLYGDPAVAANALLSIWLLFPFI